ncbi:MAG: nuclear transport factor 2 family protein [Chloroflexi bacterium]|nr:nuclear transport factor 2 family protein [Chloroflexota bacterium]
MKSPREVAESYWAAECRRDLEAVLDHFHDGAIVHPPSGSPFVGRAGIADFYRDEMRDYPGLEVEIVHEVRDGDEAALEWEAVLVDHRGARHPFRGVNVVRVRDGRFEWVRAYFDPAAVGSETA